MGYNRAKKIATRKIKSAALPPAEEERDLLRELIEIAIMLYKTETSTISANREKDIAVIQSILSNYKDYPTSEACIEELHNYFGRYTTAGKYKIEPDTHYFTTGLTDGSVLEDNITATLDAFNDYVILPRMAKEKDGDDIRISVSYAVERAWLHYENSQRRDHKTPSHSSQVKKDQILGALQFPLPELGKQDLWEAYLKIINKEINDSPKRGSFEFYVKNEIAQLQKDRLHFHEFSKETKLNYKLSDFLNYAIDKYVSESGKDEKDFAVIRQAIATYDKGGEGARLNLADALANFFNTHPEYETLNRYCKHAIQTFNDNNQKHSFDRNFKTKEWKRKEWDSSTPQQKKIIIALHGWRDSVDTWNELGQKAIADDPHTKVIAYDQRGFGFDQDRYQYEINEEMLRIDFRLFVQKVMAENPGVEISIVGHSMGCDILALEDDFIQRQAVIKSTVYVSPAVTPTIPSYFNFNKFVTMREAHDEILKNQQSNPRFEMSKRTALQLLIIMSHAFKAFTKIFDKINQKTQALPNPTDSNQKIDGKEGKQEEAVVQENAASAEIKGAKRKVFMGDKDKAVDPNHVYLWAKNDSVFKSSRGDHLLLSGRNRIPVLKQVILHIKNSFTQPVKSELKPTRK